MKVVKAEGVLALSSDLRPKLDELLKRLKQGPLLVQRHGKPAAVLMDARQFEELDGALAMAEHLLSGRPKRKPSKGKAPRPAAAQPDLFSAK